jgi:hypothetical protein
MPSNLNSSQIKNIARSLRYQELTELIGQEVVIQDISTIEEDLWHQLPGISEENKLIRPAEKYLRGALGKYSLLDLTLTASPSLLKDQYETGIRLLEKLRFVRSNASPSNDTVFGNEDDPTCLTSLMECLETDQTTILLFLRSEKLVGKGRHWLGELPQDYFPRSFEVQDACVTNADFVWFHKHFYL